MESFKPKNNFIPPNPTETKHFVDTIFTPKKNIEHINYDIIAVKTLTNLFMKLDVKYINIKTIEKMYYVCHLHTFFTILNVTYSQLDPHFGPKIRIRIVQQIKNLKTQNIKLETLIGGSGVLGYGIGAKRVFLIFKNLPTFLSKKPTINEITQINGISETIGLKIIKNYDMMIKFILLCLKEGLNLKTDFSNFIGFSNKRVRSETARSGATDSAHSQFNIKINPDFNPRLFIRCAAPRRYTRPKLCLNTSRIDTVNSMIQIK